eukprot:TRINITY_DN2512_c0_g2_i2.p1 TRINITY_DN2512_c0_g2~~TRINITY_DN2512_c0_g2_i2.p1  ORF type:complete len:134 (+),score=3.16 TRINITY_DN2512_c0_g2_i2:130-531(+)
MMTSKSMTRLITSSRIGTKKWWLCLTVKVSASSNCNHFLRNHSQSQIQRELPSNHTRGATPCKSGQARSRQIGLACLVGPTSVRRGLIHTARFHQLCSAATNSISPPDTDAKTIMASAADGDDDGDDDPCTLR